MPCHPQPSRILCTHRIVLHQQLSRHCSVRRRPPECPVASTWSALGCSLLDSIFVSFGSLEICFCSSEFKWQPKHTKRPEVKISFRDMRSLPLRKPHPSPPRSLTSTHLWP